MYHTPAFNHIRRMRLNVFTNVVKCCWDLVLLPTTTDLYWVWHSLPSPMVIILPAPPSFSLVKTSSYLVLLRSASLSAASAPWMAAHSLSMLRSRRPPHTAPTALLRRGLCHTILTPVMECSKAVVVEGEGGVRARS